VDGLQKPVMQPIAWDGRIIKR